MIEIKVLYYSFLFRQIKLIPSQQIYEAPFTTYHMEKVLYTFLQYSTVIDIFQFLRTLHQQILLSESGQLHIYTAYDHPCLVFKCVATTRERTSPAYEHNPQFGIHHVRYLFSVPV